MWSARIRQDDGTLQPPRSRLDAGVGPRRFAGASLLVLALLGVGCDRQVVERRIPTRAIVSLVGTRSDDPIWQDVCAGAARFAREAPTVKIEQILPSSATPVSQKETLEALAVRKLPSVVCVLAIDARVLIQPIGRLMTSGVNVVLVGDDAPHTRRRVFAGADERAVGETMAGLLGKLCSTHRTAMILRDDSTDHRSAARREGFRRGLRQQTDLKLLRELECTGGPTEALRLLHETSERFPNLGGWGLLGDWLHSAPAEDGPLVVGSAKIVAYGISAAGLALLEQGRVSALVGVDWEEIGYRALRLCNQLMSTSVLPVVDYRAAPVVITAENLAEWRARRRAITTSASDGR